MKKIQQAIIDEIKKLKDSQNRLRVLGIDWDRLSEIIKELQLLADTFGNIDQAFTESEKVNPIDYDNFEGKLDEPLIQA